MQRDNITAGMPIARVVLANSPEPAQLLGASAPVTWLAAAKDEKDGKKLRKFEMLAYTGGKLEQYWSDVPLVVDLAGLEGTDKSRPIFFNHDPTRIIGHTDAITIDGKSVSISGTVSGVSADAQEVVAAADNGFPWQASIGVSIQSIERIKAGESVTVNGQDFQGPVDVIRKGKFFETSFVALGADDETAARMAAAANNTPPKRGDLMKHKILMAQFVALCAAFPDLATALAEKCEIVEAKSPETDEAENTLRAWAESQAKPEPAPVLAGFDIEAERAKAAAEIERQGEIRKLCANHPDLHAKAVKEGWTTAKAELEVLRAERGGAPNINTGGRLPVNHKVLEAAALMSGRGMTEADEKRYGEQVLEAADSRFRGRIGVGQLLLEAAMCQGYQSSYANPIRSDLGGVLKAAFSTRDISGILSNIANKFLLNGFDAVEQVWRQIAAIRSVNDFKTVTSYRMTGDMTFDKVAPDGEIKHGTLNEESFTNKADTYARMLSVTRQDLINDDLGAVSDAPRRLGRGGAIKLNKVFWTEWLADAATFWTTARKNYFTGAATTLQISSLTTAVQMFRDQTDPDGDPLSLAPKFLLVPTALEVTAQNLFSGQNLAVTALGSTSAAATAPDINPHSGKYTPVVSSYLNNTAITGYSSTAWWLLPDPMDLAAIEVAFLNGQQSPVVEQADADFNTLGIQMRGYFDFGVAKQDYRAGVKSKGAA